MNLNISNFARLGKDVIFNATGLQKNHKETYIETSVKIDRSASGCYSCPNFQYIDFKEYMPEPIRAQAVLKCEHCPHKCYKTCYTEKIKYVNEKNKYGEKPRLKSLGLKLLITYHFLNPDKNGLIKDLSPGALASLLQCSVRSILNCNQMLQEFGYIVYNYSPYNKKQIHVILPQFRNYGLTAREGGRGYATLNKNVFLELLKIKDLNQLRIYLRTLLQLDTDREAITKKEISINEIRSYLPQYCKRNVICRAVSNLTNIFKIKTTAHSVVFEMNDSCHGRKEFTSKRDLYLHQFEEFFTKINGTIKRANKLLIKEKEVPKEDKELLNQHGIFAGIGLKNLYGTFELTHQDLLDLSALALSYNGIERILKCIPDIYKTYTIKRTKIKIGALIRHILQNEAHTTEISLNEAFI